jgi:hypothetical protein
MIRTLAVAATLAGAILLAPVAQAQPGSSTTGRDPCSSVANGARLSCGPNRVVPITRATPFGGTISDQPGLAIAVLNGNLVVPTGIPFGSATPMAKGNMVGPATTTTPLSGGIRTRHGFLDRMTSQGTGRTGGTSLSRALGGRFR